MTTNIANRLGAAPERGGKGKRGRGNRGGRSSRFDVGENIKSGSKSKTRSSFSFHAFHTQIGLSR